MKKQIKRKEVSIETSVRRALLALGIPFLSLKLMNGVQTGWPDMMVMLPRGLMLFIELKRDEDEKPSAKQLYIHDMLRKWGHQVEVHHDSEACIGRIKSAFMDAMAVPEEGRKVAAKRDGSRVVPRARAG